MNYNTLSRKNQQLFNFILFNILLFTWIYPYAVIAQSCSADLVITPSEICAGDTARLTVNMTAGAAPFTFAWSDNLGTDSIVMVSPSINSRFFVTVTDANNCIVIDTFDISVNQLPSPLANANMICEGEQLPLNENGTNSTSWLWSTDGIGTFDNTVIQNPIVSGARSGDRFFVTITDANGCTNFDTIANVINPAPAAIANTDGACIGDTLQLSEAGNEAIGWMWSTPDTANIINPNTQNPIATQVTDGDRFIVNITDNNGCTNTDTVIYNPSESCPDCTPDTTFTDVLFVIDNSGSIDTTEFNIAEEIIIGTLERLNENCPSGNFAVMHYGGDYGEETSLEYAFGEANTADSIVRQFCVSDLCIQQGGGTGNGNTEFSGDNLNHAMGVVLDSLTAGKWNHNPDNNLQIVIFSDAGSYDTLPCRGGFFDDPFCTKIYPFDNINTLKSSPFDAQVTVVGMETQALGQLLAGYASSGGSYTRETGLEFYCEKFFEGCDSGPKKYIGFLPRRSDVDATVTEVVGCVECEIDIVPVLRAELEATSTPEICENDTAIFILEMTSGTAPYQFMWSDNLGSDSVVRVSPSMDMRYTVTVTDSNNCVVVDTIDLVVNPLPPITRTLDTLCDNESVTFNNQVISAAGDYFDTLTNVEGCDSIVQLTIVPCQEIDLNLIKFVSDTFPNWNDTVRYGIRVSNEGPQDATGVEVTDSLPSQIRAVFNLFPNGTLTNNQITWDNLSIPAGGVIQLSYEVTFNEPTTLERIVNVAEITGADQEDSDSTPGSGADSDNDGNIGSEHDDHNQDPDDEDDGDDAFVVLQMADISLVKTVNNASPTVGERVVYRIVVRNDGPHQATGVNIEDVIPNGLTAVGTINENGTLSGDTITWRNKTVAVNDSIILGYTAEVVAPSSGISYVNIAEVTAMDQHDVDSTPGNGADTDNDGNIGREDNDHNQDPDDEDDGDDALVAPCDLSVSTNTDQSICPDDGEVAQLTAMARGGTPPYSYSWSNGLGASSNKTVAPQTSTTYTVTATDANGCTATDQVSVSTNACFLAQDCVPDTISSDILFMVDNSQSISTTEYEAFENIILATLNKVQAQCAQANIGVLHYGGAFGREVAIEYNIANDNNFTQVERQFCSPSCTSNGGDDLNVSMDSVIRFFDNGTLNRDPRNNLSIVVLTDASGNNNPCGNNNCSTLLPLTNVDRLKAAPYNASIVVAGFERVANDEVLSLYASPGGSYNGPIDSGLCGSTFDGCRVPRKYLDFDRFDEAVDPASDRITQCIQCDIEVIEGLAIEVNSSATTVCEDDNETVTLAANVTSGTPPFTFEWDNGLGTGPNKMVTPTQSTTYTVTVTDDNDCMTEESVSVQVEQCIEDCEPDTTFSDVLFMVDNSMSIDATEYDFFEEMILQSLSRVQGGCPSANIGVLHYGGAFGAEVAIEYNLSNTNNFTQIQRQFCTPSCTRDGGDDLNAAMGSVVNFINDGTLNRTPGNNFTIVVLTDASGNNNPCGNTNCSTLLPLDNVDILKSAPYNASVVVTGITRTANDEVLAAYASPGGSYNGPIDQTVCPGTVDGCQLPRKYIDVDRFDEAADQVSRRISDCVECQVQINNGVAVDAGEDQTICANQNQSVTLTAQASIGTPPYTYVWDNGLGVGPVKIVSPSQTTTYSVTVTDEINCEAVDEVTVFVTNCDDCVAEAGSPLMYTHQCLENGRAVLRTEPNVGRVIPPGYEVVYILTNEDLIVLDYIIGEGTFTVTQPGVYRIHTLIAEVSDPTDENYLDLQELINRGSSNIFVVVNCIRDHGICADFDFAGRVHKVLDSDHIECRPVENNIILCMDGIDNDGDGLIDCLDPDCMVKHYCRENTIINCNDLVDNDLDGLIDCQDPSCWSLAFCDERDELCRDGIDNDGDGLTDCEEDGCRNSLWCVENNIYTCKDGKDNDNDGLVDCADRGCQNLVICAESNVEACEDGEDNDRDGLVDCADMDCRMLANINCSVTEATLNLCSDGIDNDGDGLIDCEDDECGMGALNEMSSQFDRFIAAVDASCETAQDGFILIQGDLADGDYQYQINDGPTTSNTRYDNLGRGIYTVRIFTISGCMTSTNVVIGSGTCATAEICNNGIDDDQDGEMDCGDSDCGITGFSGNIDLTMPGCADENKGSIVINGQAQGFDYRYSIDGGRSFHATNIFAGLGSGRYFVMVRTEAGCFFAERVDLVATNCVELCDNNQDDDGDGLVDCEDPDCGTTIFSDQIEIVQATCRDSSDGEITINGQLQAYDYVYSIDGGMSFQDEPTFTGLAVGSYSLVVLNEFNECEYTQEVVLEEFECIEPVEPKVDIELKVFLQGPYNPVTQKMNTALNRSGYLPGQTPRTIFGRKTPLQQPYQEGPWFYEGTEAQELAARNSGGKIYAPTVVDWVLVSLRQNQVDNTSLWSGAALLHEDGRVELINKPDYQLLKDQSFYLTIEHRNHLPAQSVEALQLTEDGRIVYDFTNNDSYRGLFGVGQVKLEDGQYAMYAGNADVMIERTSPVDINALDYSDWMINNGVNSSYFLQDFDMNGDVNVLDRILWERNNGLFSSVPR